MTHPVCLPSFVREPSLTKQSLLRQQVAVAPNAATAAHCLVQRDATVQTSVDTFFRAEQLMQSLPPIRPSERPLMFRSEPLELEVDGRRSEFELCYFPTTRVTVACDKNDERFVAVKREAARW